MNDDELIKQMRAGDEMALSEVVKKYTPLIVTIINNIANGILNAQDVEDCCSGIFYTLWLNADKVQSGSLKGYICSIAKSKTKDMLRGIRLVDAEDISELSLADDFSLYEYLDNKQLQSDLKAAVGQFEKQDREILVRYYYYYQTAPQIAALTGLSTEAVKSRIKRAKPKMKEFLRERGYEV